MKIRNLLVSNEYIDELQVEMCKNNIQYLLIKTDFYHELHVKDNIYRFFIIDCIHKLDFLDEIAKAEFYSGTKEVLVKERPGYKILKKSDYKRKKY